MNEIVLLANMNLSSANVKPNIQGNIKSLSFCLLVFVLFCTPTYLVLLFPKQKVIESSLNGLLRYVLTMHVKFGYSRII